MMVVPSVYGQDEGGNKFLLLPDLVTNQAPLPADLYMSFGSTNPVARVTRRYRQTASRLPWLSRWGSLP